MPQREIDTLRQAFHDSSTSASNQRFNRFYPFWKIDPDEEVTVRFLPDPDSDNPLGFLVENRTACPCTAA